MRQLSGALCRLALPIAVAAVWGVLPAIALAQTSAPSGPGAGQQQAAPPSQPGQPTQGQPPARGTESDPALSRECQTPGLTLSGTAALPNVTRALRERKVIRILTIGASSAGGRGAADNNYYGLIESILEKAVPGLDVKLIDRGVSGELAANAAERMKTEVALVNPDLVLWQVGTHDALMHVPVAEFRQTVADTLDWLKAHNVDAVVVGLHYLKRLATDRHYQAVRTALARVLEAKKVMRIGRYEAQRVIEQARQASHGLAVNEFAATEAGYACLSEYVVKALSSGIFARPQRAKPGKGT
jgi:lysophospholipase L1-like esterase